MDFLLLLLDIVLHLDKHISVLIQYFGVWIYVIMFLIIFCETGLVVTPFLPGDSLLFALGTFAAKGDLDVYVLFGILTAAAIIGDSVNYAIGKYIGPKVFRYEDSFFFKKEYLERTHNFYEKHGGKTIVLARFIPIIRTFAPFVAGMGTMNYPHFLFYNVFGALSWISLFLAAGYKFGEMPFVQENFFLVIVAIIILSILPGVVEYIRNRLQKDRP